MIDPSLSALGAQVVVASSGDEHHPPENITDGNTKTFWMSTGMFPQEFIIRFAEPTNISAVTVDSFSVRSTFLRVVPVAWLYTLVTKKKVIVYSSSEETDISIPLNDTTDESSDGQKDDNVKNLKIERNTSQNASEFESVTEKDFEQTEGHLQANAISLNGSSATTHLRFIITSGYDHFVSVHRVGVQH